jgi:hypothetical protein
MTDGEGDKKWRDLCERAQAEQDPKKLIELATEISRLLEEKEARLRGLRREATK